MQSLQWPVLPLDYGSPPRTNLDCFVDALQKAGEITLYANLRNVVLQRRLPGDDPIYKRTNLNLLALLQEGDQLHNPLILTVIRCG